MFTGLIEETGTVESIESIRGGRKLRIALKVCGKDLKRGDSLAVNGCCLTVTGLNRDARGKFASFDVLEETWGRTNLQFAKNGSVVNLERPLAIGARLGGHFVTGHIDGTGVIDRWERKGADHLLDITAPRDVMDYVVHKGSVAVDGISLTVAGVKRKSFRIWIIPHTYEVTALRQRKVGDAVNLEADLIGKYVRMFVGRGSAWACSPGIK
jgi:riboflavin synthase